MGGNRRVKAGYLQCSCLGSRIRTRVCIQTRHIVHALLEGGGCFSRHANSDTLELRLMRGISQVQQPYIPQVQPEWNSPNRCLSFVSLIFKDEQYLTGTGRKQLRVRRKLPAARCRARPEWTGTIPGITGESSCGSR